MTADDQRDEQRWRDPHPGGAGPRTARHGRDAAHRRPRDLAVGSAPAPGSPAAGCAAWAAARAGPSRFTA